MKQWVFSIYDSKAELFHQPMFFKSKPEAIRAFSDEANRQESSIFKHPGDYTLSLIGTVDIHKGLLTPLPTPQSLGLGVEFQEHSNLDMGKLDLVDKIQNEQRN